MPKIDKIELTQNMLRLVSELEHSDKTECDINSVLFKLTGLRSQSLFYADEIEQQLSYVDDMIDTTKITSEKIIEVANDFCMEDETFSLFMSEIENVIRDEFLNNDKYRLTDWWQITHD